MTLPRDYYVRVAGNDYSVDPTGIGRMVDVSAEVTPHLFRRTVATAVNDNANVELAAELLGHTDTKITVQHYIRRSEVVNPATAELLDKVFAKDGD
ncbi:tyrosine-type recombinase/integrase [Cryobacterium sp. Hb1]|uniref:Mu transposase domain-containing protein n=1 Tax=Cryobacterium sp. Hb1 TaxID=1259147 RepID=UPI00351A0286